MKNYVYKTVNNFHSCPEHCGNPYHQRNSKLFSPKGPLENIIIDRLGPLHKKKCWNWHGLFIINRYRRMTRAIPVSSISAPSVTNVFLNNLIIPYGIQKALPSENGPQLARKFFAAFYAFYGTDLTTTTECHLQTNG